MIILEIIQVIFQSILGVFKAIALSVPSILELKECLEIFTPSGMFTEYIKYLGIPAFAITMISFIVILIRRYKI